MIRQYLYWIKIVFQIMTSLLKSNYYNQRLLIINFIILFYEYYLTWSEHHRASVVIFVLLTENVRNSKVRDVSFHSISFQEIIMNKKNNWHKNILELTKCLLGFIRSFKRTFFLFILVSFEQVRQRRNYFKIAIYKALIKVNEFQKYLHFAINFELKSFFNHLNSFRIHLYSFCEYYEV